MAIANFENSLIYKEDNINTYMSLIQVYQKMKCDFLILDVLKRAVCAFQKKR